MRIMQFAIVNRQRCLLPFRICTCTCRWWTWKAKFYRRPFPEL